MRGIAAEARAWSVRAIAGGSAGGVASGPVGLPARDDVDAVKMLMPDSAMGQRVGGSGGRGPLLRRLQRPVFGEPCCVEVAGGREGGGGVFT